MTEYSITWTYLGLFMHLSVAGHLGSFLSHVLAIVNNVGVNVCVQLPVWTYVLNSLGYLFDHYLEQLAQETKL